MAVWSLGLSHASDATRRDPTRPDATRRDPTRAARAILGWITASLEWRWFSRVLSNPAHGALAAWLKPRLRRDPTRAARAILRWITASLEWCGFARVLCIHVHGCLVAWLKPRRHSDPTRPARAILRWITAWLEWCGVWQTYVIYAHNGAGDLAACAALPKLPRHGARTTLGWITEALEEANQYIARRELSLIGGGSACSRRAGRPGTCRRRPAPGKFLHF